MISESLKGAARARESQQAPQPDAASMMRYGCEPFDLLRSFEAVRGNDIGSAGVLFASITKACVDAFFGLNRILPSGPMQAIEKMRAVSPGAARAVESVMRIPLSQLCADPRPLEEMIKHTVGDERDFMRAPQRQRQSQESRTYRRQAAATQSARGSEFYA